MALLGRRTRGNADRGPVVEWLVVGLGNPGRQYRETRHNVGQAAVELVADRCGSTLRAGRDESLSAEVRLAEARAVVAVPITYMNDSGRAVAALARRYRVTDPERLIVVHDELDLPPGTVRVKRGGGLAGHNGLRSITQQLGTQDYLRIRIGVGKPPSAEQGARHVLERIGPRDRPVFEIAVSDAADAVETVVARGVDAASQEFNSR